MCCQRVADHKIVYKAPDKIIVGKLINATRKRIDEVIENRDKVAIQKVTPDLVENGADYIDVNVGTFPGEEKEYLKWPVRTVQETVDILCYLDSHGSKSSGSCCRWA